MAPPAKNTKGLKNPAAIAVAASPAGQQALTKSGEITTQAAKEGITLLAWGLRFVVVGGLVVMAVNLLRNRFQPLGENKNYAASNITNGQAEAKANAIYGAMRGFGADVLLVASQLQGLNYNGWVKVYNAFGNRKGVNPFGDAMNLVEWLNDQFNEEELVQLRFVLPNVF